MTSEPAGDAGGEPGDATGSGAGAAAAPTDSARPDAEDQAPEVPEPIRRRAAQYAYQAMRSLDEADVPSSLRVARGWRRGAMPRGFQQRLSEVLAQDPAFRGRVAAHLIDTDPTASAVAAEEAVAGDQDDAAVAALLLLLRPDHWQQRIQAVLPSAAEDLAPALERAQFEIENLRNRLQRQQSKRDKQVASLRQEAEDARRKESATTSRLQDQARQARQALDQAVAASDQAQQQVQELQREVRRLRGQLAQAESGAERAKTDHRDARVAANARAKVLLEVLADSVAGLAEELAVPAGSPAPADLVEAEEPAPLELPKRLYSEDQLALALTLPRSHLLVDGYNVTKGLWPNAPLQQQRDRLVTALGALQSRTGAEVTVVFDGAEVTGVPAVASRAVRVRFSAAGELADTVLVRLAAAEPPGRPVLVVSSDAAVASGARRVGARTVDREVLTGLLPT